MIGRLQGELVEVNSDHVVIDVQGVGDDVYPHARALMVLPGQLGQTVRLWIHTHVREDALQLFGFLSHAEKELFLQLLKVNGVGPKLALNLLSGAEIAEITEWIESGNAKALSQIPKVGKKTAEQIILTLQGQLVRVEPKKKGSNQAFKEIHFALTNLGFKPQVVDEFITTLPVGTEVEVGIRQGLLQLSQRKGDSYGPNS